MAAAAFFVALAGYNLLVTSEVHMDEHAICLAYRNLWRIEESFRVMKSQLDARPVYLQKREAITVHFLICYLAVLLVRILQILILGDAFGSETLFSFMRQFKVVKISGSTYINNTRSTPFLKALAASTALPLSSFYLSNSQINAILNHRFNDWV